MSSYEIILMRTVGLILSTQSNAWKSLSVSRDFFNGCKTHPVIYIPAENHKRKYYFLGWESLIFRNENGDLIWSTKGDGEIELPAAVAVHGKTGKMKGGYIT